MFLVYSCFFVFFSSFFSGFVSGLFFSTSVFLGLFLVYLYVVFVLLTVLFSSWLKRNNCVPPKRNAGTYVQCTNQWG